MRHAQLTRLDGRPVMPGCGSIGQGALALMLRHIELDPSRITILSRGRRGDVAKEVLNKAIHGLI